MILNMYKNTLLHSVIDFSLIKDLQLRYQLYKFKIIVFQKLAELKPGEELPDHRIGL